MSDEIALVVLFAAACVIIIAKCVWHGEYTQDIFIGPGTYIVGRDIPPGKGDLIAEKGGGDFCIKEKGAEAWSLRNKLGVVSGLQPSRFRNVCLNKGDTLEINGNVNIMITPPVPIRDVSEEALGPGNYRFGIDCPPGRYDLEVLSGEGPVFLFEVGNKDYTFFQDMAAGNDFKASEFANVSCGKGYEMWIQGSLQIKLHYSAKQDIWL